MSQYGKSEKTICFDSNSKVHADLKIRLHYDGIKIREFFNEMIIAYLNDDKHIIKFVENLKELKRLSKTKRRKTVYDRGRASAVIEQFGLNESEIENIFDILEKECDS